MSKNVVVTLPTRAKADEAVSALEKLHDEASVTVYGSFIVKREADGTLTTLERDLEGGAASGVGALLGALIGAFAGPVGAAMGLAAGATTGAVGGIVHGEVSDEFLEDVAKTMAPNTYAVLAEVSETSTAPIDMRMEALGGKVLREYRADVVADVLEKRAIDRSSRLDAWKAKHADAKAERTQHNVELEAMDMLEKLRRTGDKARVRLDDAKQELEEKLALLEAQAETATPEVKKDIDKRIEELRADFAARERKLSHALDVADEALA